MVASAALLGGGALALTAHAASAGTSTTSYVTASSVGTNLQWHPEDTDADTGTFSFVTGPNHPPGNAGSLAMSMTSGQHEWLNNYAYGACKSGPACNTPVANWTPLSSISALGFSTFRASGTVTATLNMEVDATGTGSGYATFVFVPNAVTDGVWQTWNALDPSQGYWFSSKNITTPPAGPFACAPQSSGCTHTFAEITAGYPSALIKLGIGPNIGTGGTFTGNIDNMVVGVSGNTTTYDFEVNPPTPPTVPPAAKPGAPRPVAAVPGNKKATVSWKKPANTGGHPITGYIVTPYLGSTALHSHGFASTATKQTITGLKNKSAYRFSVAAQTSAGIGPSSPLTGAIIVGAPGSPGNIKVTASDGTLTVAFKAPANNGAKITGYATACTSKNGGAPATATGGHSPISVSGATAGKTYRCTVTATNSRGHGPRSAASALVTA